MCDDVHFDSLTVVVPIWRAGKCTRCRRRTAWKGRGCRFKLRLCVRCHHLYRELLRAGSRERWRRWRAPFAPRLRHSGIAFETERGA